MKLHKFGALLLCALISLTGFSQIDLTYQEPPEAIVKLADAEPTPLVSLQSEGDMMLIVKRPTYKSIEEVASKEYRLAGLRINPAVHGPSRIRFYNDIALMKMGSQDMIPVKGLPDKPLISNISWSPDESKVGFTIQRKNGIELWYMDVENAQAKQLTKAEVNDVMGGNPYLWLKDNSGMVVRFKNPNRGELISADQIPTGPTIMQNLGETAPARTYQDLLKNHIDEENFDYFAMSKLVKVDLEGRLNEITDIGIFRAFDLSPDGKYLMTWSVEKPYSYLVPYYRFPLKTEIRTLDGSVVKVLYEAPLEESRPKGFMATSKWPRSHSWVSSKAATVSWVEALDEGDPENDVEFRDKVMILDAPFSGNAKEIAKTRLRYSGITWGADVAVLSDYWWNTRENNMYRIDPNGTNTTPKVLFSYSSEDLYDLPGNFVTAKNKYGENELLTTGKGKKLYLQGEGYSPEGNRPFIDEYDVASGKTSRLYRAAGEGNYERIIEVRNISKGELITTIESPNQNPNYYLRNTIKRIAPQQITFFPNPYESIKDVSKQMISYKRDDGVELNAVLYLPAGYDKSKDGPLPMLMWAYPREFKNIKAAGMVKESPYRFTYVSYGSPIFWVARGYAVLDRTDFPIVGVGDEEPNDTFVEQLVGNAAAAIDAVSEMGVVDPQRVGVGGHSYGAFMTANLLAHSDLFAAGIARSGAYNRTLTPFGFQAEERTFWEAPDIYFKMSPFMHANKINEPLLMVHGTQDNNSGTFPMQSERMYNAIKGHGGTTRLVMLPYESHGYAARESVMHMLWEMDTWLETYVKDKDKLDAENQDITPR